MSAIASRSAPDSIASEPAMTDIDLPKPRTLPDRLVVTLRAGGAFFAAANVICVAILAWTFLAVKLEPKTLAVTGSAHKAIVSDVVDWTGTVTVKDPQLGNAYDAVKAATDKVVQFLVQHGIPEADITRSSISISRRYHQEAVFAPPSTNGIAAAGPTFVTTDAVDMFTLTQSISISSQDMVHVPEVSRSVTSLIKDGVEIDSGAPVFRYTKLAELKIDMLAEATKDATLRAEQIVDNAHGRLGKLIEARMGVIQINPKGASATSAEGINDTTSFEKDISAIVSVRFEVK
jgi:hypothetical protein